ncbi:hypothetical protein SCP_1500150 [Sparassis crispa]|uniref:Uncharacterized protein n=1 Tax=Sparassis crispa TaxID=139825 RepID=A0A401H3N3_9APHY|nr:hypothetical protein SCP_1500150 [Sparassis crispa]GBE89013.1 hypothetical protein SCP_1500150 [Sparassis crispa]
MLLSSPPSTPSRSTRYQSISYGFFPLRSSPLASSSPPPEGRSPPLMVTQARRRSQYKAQLPSSPTTIRTRKSEPRRASLGGSQRAEAVVPTEEAPRKAFLRERFRQRCIERAQKDRERKIRGKRYMSDLSSDGADECMDEDDEDEEAIMDDELFRRIMSSANRKQQHSYRLSYSYDVGSSFDPDLEDLDEWEAQLNDVQPDVPVPEDYEEDEIAAYAEEYQLHLEDLDLEQVFSTSDLEDQGVDLEDAPMFTRTQDEGKGKEVVSAFDDDIDMAM